MNIYEAAKVEWFEKCAEIYLEKIALGTTAAPGGFMSRVGGLFKGKPAAPLAHLVGTPAGRDAMLAGRQSGAPAWMNTAALTPAADAARTAKIPPHLLGWGQTGG